MAGKADRRLLPARCAGECDIWMNLKEKARQFNADAEIQGLLQNLTADPDNVAPILKSYSPENLAKLNALEIDRPNYGKRGYDYEKLDQLTTELLLGIR